RTVCGVTASVVPAFHAAGKTLTLADATDVHQLTGLEILNQHAVPDLRLVLRFLDPNFLQDLHRGHIGLLEMAGQGPVHALRLADLDHAHLRGVIAILLFRAALHHDAGPGLQSRAPDQIAVSGKDLRYAHLDSNNPVTRHFLFSLSQLASSGLAG